MTANGAISAAKIRTYTFDSSPTRIRRKKTSDTSPGAVKRADAGALNIPSASTRSATGAKSVSASARGAAGAKSVSASARGATGAKSVSASARSVTGAKSISASARGVTGAKSISANTRGSRTARRSVDDIRLKRALEAVEGKKAKEKDEPKIHTVASLRRIPFPTAVIFMTIICTALFMGMIMSFVRINEMTIELESLERDAAALAKTQSELTLSLEKKNDLREIERYATEELGMVKIDQLAKKYITLDVAEKIELTDESTGGGNAVSDFFSDILNNIRDFFAYIG
ncbi:MAG: hypothetical protein WCQ72_04880 [Eubacteriales bacterium]